LQNEEQSLYCLSSELDGTDMDNHTLQDAQVVASSMAVKISETVSRFAIALRVFVVTSERALASIGSPIRAGTSVDESFIVKNRN
jgi:hypothetical protein